MKTEHEEQEEQEAREYELIYKKSYYKNINSIRKNVQFFFWAIMIPMILYVIKFLLDLNP